MTTQVPAGISPQALNHFDEVCELLKDNSLLDNQPVFLTYLELYADWQDNRDQISKKGQIIEQAGKLIESPYVKAADSCQTKLNLIIAEYGTITADINISLDDDLTITNKKKRFIREYVKDQNRRQAAIRAGYKERTAGFQANNLMREEKVILHIKVLTARILEEIGITAEMIYQGFLKEAKGEGPDTNASARNMAWQMLAKLKGMFRDDNAQQSGVAAIIDNLSPEALESFTTALEAELDGRVEVERISV